MRLFALSLLLIASENAAVSQAAASRNACPVEDPDSHLIAPGDIVGYCEVGEECWGRDAIVSDDGKIVIPFLGEIQVLGQTSHQLAQVIEQRLSKYHRNPSVRVHVKDPNKYFVDGEANHPGSYCLDTPTTVLEALDISGGLRKQANPKKIRILRGTEVLRFNYKDVRKGKYLEQNILIEKGDHVIVARSY